MSELRPRVLLVSYSPLVRDARVLKQIRLFRDRYALTTCGYGPAPDGVVEHLRIPDEVVYWHKDRRAVLARQYARAYRTAPITRWVRSALGEQHFEVVLANDVDTVPLAVGLRDEGRTAAVHADLHEYSSRQKEEVRTWRWFVAPYYRWMVRRAVTRADSVTTVGAGLAAEYRREFGVVAAVVVNAPAHADLDPTPVATPLRLVHAGNAVPSRLEVMLEAVEQMRSGATLDLYLVDPGDGYVGRLSERFAAHPRVRVHDPVPTADVVGTLNAYDVGVYVLPPVSFNFRYALPNKFFDFVQARLAVVVGPSPEMAGLVRRHALGVVTEDFTAPALARTLDRLTAQEVAAAKAASHAAAATLSAEATVSGWVEAIERLATRPPGPMESDSARCREA